MEEHAEEALQPRVIRRMNREVGFGHIRSDDGRFQFIFVVGKAISNRRASRLAVHQ